MKLESFKPGGIVWSLISRISILRGRGRIMHPDEPGYRDWFKERVRAAFAAMAAQPNSRLQSVELQGPVKAAKSRFESIPIFDDREVVEWQRLT